MAIIGWPIIKLAQIVIDNRQLFQFMIHKYYPYLDNVNQRQSISIQITNSQAMRLNCKDTLQILKMKTFAVLLNM